MKTFQLLFLPIGPMPASCLCIWRVKLYPALVSPRNSCSNQTYKPTSRFSRLLHLEFLSSRPQLRFILISMALLIIVWQSCGDCDVWMWFPGLQEACSTRQAALFASCFCYVAAAQNKLLQKFCCILCSHPCRLEPLEQVVGSWTKAGCSIMPSGWSIRIGIVFMHWIASYKLLLQMAIFGSE